MHLTAFVFAPIFARYGNTIGPKLLYNIGAFAQGAAGIAFGCLEFINGTALFLGLSYLFRYWVYYNMIVLTGHQIVHTGTVLKV